MITTSASPFSIIGRSAARSAGDPWYSSGFKTDSETYSLISCAQCPTSVGGHTTSAGRNGNPLFFRSTTVAARMHVD
jgi:hypothetical protein